MCILKITFFLSKLEKNDCMPLLRLKCWQHFENNCSYKLVYGESLIIFQLIRNIQHWRLLLNCDSFIQCFSIQNILL